MNWIQQLKQSALKNEWQIEWIRSPKAAFRIFSTIDRY